MAGDIVMRLGDMVRHKTNKVWQRGKIYGIVSENPPKFMILWGNGDLVPVDPAELEPLGWNLYERGSKN